MTVKTRKYATDDGIPFRYLCSDTHPVGHDIVDDLSAFIAAYDPKLKRAFTPERARIACYSAEIEKKGLKPHIIQSVDKYNTERSRDTRTGRYVSGERAIQILVEQLN